ncbi:MAG TPA: hypothetical protein DCM05_11425 [Elusimicrobia bacterium]|nr:hypothetical protein [Elusimicrobiota bacterium]
MAAFALANQAAAEPFSYVGVQQLQQLDLAVPSVKAEASQDKIEKSHLFAQCGRKVLFGYADSDAEYAEALAYWTKVLAEAGIQAGKPTFEHGMYLLPYEAGGLVLRDFRAEPKQFKPKDEASLRENMNLIANALHARGLPIVAAKVVNLEFMLPTYSLYYLTKPEEREETETQARVLKPGEDIDFDLLTEKGVDIVQKPEPWMMVYVGKEVGFVSRLAKDQAEAEKKLKERVELLTKMGKVFIGSRIHPLTEPFEDYKLLVNIYFYQ